MDEAHQLLTSQHYRNDFKNVRQLADLKIQKIFLTATLPIHLEADFLKEAGLPLSTRILRAPCDQPHISYNILQYSTMNTSVVRLAIEIARMLEKDFMDADQGGIIFVKSTELAKELHKKFTNCSSHRDQSTANQSKYESNWKNGKHRWIAATTTLIQGIDKANVGAVIFIEVPYGLLNLYQGAGRTGRDGRKSWAVLLNPSNQYVMTIQGQQDYQCESEGGEWSRGNECRRLGFTRLLDGREVPCSMLPNCHLCDICDPGSQLMDSIRPMIVDPLVPPPALIDEEDEYDRYNMSKGNIDLALIPDPTSAFTPHPLINPPPSYLAPPTAIVPSMVILSAPAPIDEDNEYDDYNLSVGNINPALIPDPISTFTQHQQINPPPSHLAPPTAIVPSMAILRDVSYYQQMLSTKSQKADAINRLTVMLLDKCVLCYCYKSDIVNKHPNIWTRCKPSRGYIPHMSGMYEFKHRIQFAVKYIYCYKCGLPQEKEHMPSCHPIFENGAVGCPCPLEDFVIMFVWFIRNEAAWWQRACEAFPRLVSNWGEVEFSRWVCTIEGIDSFYNGIELMLWFYLEKGRE
jgi:hypothetical protein